MPARRTATGLRRPQILDVTLRDGGYLNAWRFSDATVREHAKVLGEVGVPYVEVGYISDDPALEATLQCAPDLLRQIGEDTGQARVVAMLGVNGRGPQEVTDLLRPRAEVLDVVRLTCFVERVDHVLAAAEAVCASGVTCSLNLISITAYEPEELVAAVERVDRSGVAEWLYLADSRGALLPEAATELFAGVRAAWSGTAGFHAHDNLGHAVANSRIALEAGFDLVDGSLNGYGLGGGNTDLAEALALVGEVDRPRLASLAERLAAEMPPPPPFQHLYPLTGRRNLEQEWAPDVWEAHGEGSEEFLRSLSWKRYKDVGEILRRA
ncbi:MULTISPECIES: beta/alpha barrel domain-containing protein [Nocardiopsis]|uniref:4-hydroxy 2-oxovalerate aldolase n=1 Tax=Nocardiopsis sinuspersici TaxID=501010 RepID=A0A1V3C070_9ACTN|nr:MULTISPECIES: pyruvate carboxyltransferase [Nocardiopsis]NYH55030.1 4-hydroxy 2-oxovalerate aldolase [Nocardiopsis sinuspersici]OOC53750.1 pyruvate carboxyltransferase [Nocardiopsis sinuspersici]